MELRSTVVVVVVVPERDRAPGVGSAVREDAIGHGGEPGRRRGDHAERVRGTGIGGALRALVVVRQFGALRYGRCDGLETRPKFICFLLHN